MNFERALIEEIAGLERELEGDPRFQKLRALQAALAYYQPGGSGASSPFHHGAFLHTSEIHRNARTHSHGYDGTFTDASGSLHVFQAKRKGGRQRDPERQSALDEAVKFVQEHGGMPTTAEVYEYLVGRGITIGGQSPKGNLSAMLYKDGRLTSHGRSGWTFGPKPAGASEEENASEDERGADAPPSNAPNAEWDEETRKLLGPALPRSSDSPAS